MEYDLFAEQVLLFNLSWIFKSKSAAIASTANKNMDL